MEREQYEGAEGAEANRGEAAKFDERNHERAGERERETFERVRAMVAEVKDRVAEVVWEKPKEFVRYCRKEGLSGMFKDFLEKLSSSGEGVPDAVKTEATKSAVEGDETTEG